jgi:hypothetical protein
MREICYRLGIDQLVLQVGVFGDGGIGVGIHGAFLISDSFCFYNV